MWSRASGGGIRPKTLYIFCGRTLQIDTIQMQKFVHLYCYYDQQFRSFISHNFPSRHFQLKFCCFCSFFFIVHVDMMRAFLFLFEHFFLCISRLVCWLVLHPMDGNSIHYIQFYLVGFFLFACVFNHACMCIICSSHVA